MRNEQDKNNKKKRHSTTLRKRILALVLSFAMLLTAIYVPELGGIFENIPRLVHAATSPTSIVNINSLYKLYEFSNSYSSSDKGARITINISGDFVLENNHTFDASETESGTEETLSYVPLGTQNDAFNGEIRITQAENTPQIIKGTLPLFGYVTDAVEIYRTGTTDSQQLSLIRSDVSSEPLFARNVVAKTEGTTASTWNFLISPYSNTTDEGTTVSVYDFGGIIGNIGGNAQVKMVVDNAAVDNSGNGANITSNDNAGMICGAIGSNSVVDVTFFGMSSNHSLNEEYSVTSSGGEKSAGGFVGEMNAGSTLNIYLPAATTDYDVCAPKTITATGATSYAGGLVGNNKGGLVNIYNQTVVAGENEGEYSTNNTIKKYESQDTVKANTGAGGIFGYFLANSDWTGNELYSINGCMVNAKYAGGFVGILDSASFDVSFGGTEEESLSVNAVVTSGVSVDAFGGIVGKYISKDLSKSLKIEHISVNLSKDGSPSFDTGSAFGGTVGFLDGSEKDHTAAYLYVNDYTVNATSGHGTATYFGGVVGKTGNKGSMVDVGDFKLIATGAFQGGGVVGYLQTGVLRLSGTTDLTEACANSSTSGNSSRGQLVGARGAALVYALGNGADEEPSYGDGWRFERFSGTQYADDIGTWGEVVRLKNIEDTTSGILTYDEDAHTVEIAGAVLTMDSTADLVATALNMQLNSGTDVGALLFADHDNTSYVLLSSYDLKVSGGLSFAGTGITSFTRDDGANGNFSGTISGSTGKTTDIISLASGEKYGIYNDANANAAGQIFAHKYNGLFAKSEGGTVTKLTVNGSLDISTNVETVYIGGVAAQIVDGLSVTDSIVGETINISPVVEKKQKYIGGIAGGVSASNSNDVTISGSTISSSIVLKGVSTSTESYIGGSIGYVESVEAFKIELSSNTISSKVDATGASTADENLNMAGLISEIANNDVSDTRTVVLTGNTFSGIELKNRVSGVTGGLLGYKWYNTDTEFTTNTFSGNNLLYSDATDMSALVYLATGYWQIKANGLKIDALTIKGSNGSDRSKNAVKEFGFIINKGYYDKADTDRAAVYLELQETTSYSLSTSGVSVPEMTEGVYDELAAYTSDDVLSNDCGVITIQLSDVVKMNGTDCNTYQNKFNKTLGNGNARYYYNIAKNKISGTAQYKLINWSLTKYSSSNINHCFTNPFTNNTISLSGSLAGYSYYPIDIDDSIIINGSTFTFENEKFEKSEAATTAKGNTDEFVRSSHDVNSQHYLLHTGLFRNVSASITTSDNITFAGNTGVVSDSSGNILYTGAFINGSLTGTVNTASGKTITFKNKLTSGEGSSAAVTNNGYLFINSINENAENKSVVLNLNGVRIDGGTYGNKGVTYADSMIGDVQGRRIRLNFNDIKIDARDTVGSPSGLTTVYTTTKSIFNYATLLNKLDVDNESTAVYNFAQSEDWVSGAHTSAGGKVTYGKELTSTIEFSNRGTSEENKYYDDDRYYIDPENCPSSTTEEYNFNSGFLPYVRFYSDTLEGAPTASYNLHEIKVNVRSTNLTSGCGTYDHPYVISDPKQLIDLAETINGTGQLAAITLPKEVAKVDDNYHNHWCYDAENNKLTCDSTYTYGDSKYTSTSGGEEWSLEQVREYLAGAYYEIDGAITISSAAYKGLGASDATAANNNDTGKYAFRGVIVGVNGGSIVNNTKTPFIKISNGCVVKNLSISVYVASSTDYCVTSATTTEAFGYTQTNVYYGGVIGEVMGGDNIIDNVSVSYQNNNQRKSLSAIQPRQTIGAYVGVVVNGGLIFRNMSSANFDPSSFKVGNKDSNTLDYTQDDGSDTNNARLYTNPYVGRVINGYAINETDNYSGDSKTYSLENNKKNYRIPNVNPNETSKLKQESFTASDGTVMPQLSVPNGQALFVLSLITQSGAGTATTANGDYEWAIGYEGDNLFDDTAAARYTATHLAQYTGIGSTVVSESGTVTGSAPGSIADYQLSKKDTTANKKAIPYLIYQYTEKDSSENYPMRTVTGMGREGSAYDGWYIMLTNNTDKYVYNLPDCFRGIGSICRFRGLPNHGNVIGGNNNVGQSNESTAVNTLNTLMADMTNYDEDGKFAMKLYGMEGNGKKINVNLDYKIYANNVDNYIQTVYNNSSYYNNNTYYDSSKCYHVRVAFGLFNYFKQINKDGNVQQIDNGLRGVNTNNRGNVSAPSYNLDQGWYIGNFTLTGNISVTEYNDNGKLANGDRNNNGNARMSSRHSVGGVIGALTVNDYINFFKLNMSDITIKGTNNVGGYIGRNDVTAVDISQGADMNYIFINACSSNNMKVVGDGGLVGGYLAGGRSGYACMYVNTASAKEGEDERYIGEDNHYKSELNLGLETYATAGDSGVGGVLGAIRNGYQVDIWVNNVTVSGMTTFPYIRNTYESSTAATIAAGGIIGECRKFDSLIITNCEVKNINISAPTAGGVLGGVDNNNFNNYLSYGSLVPARIVNCKVYSDDEDNTYEIRGVGNAGGIMAASLSDKDYNEKRKGYDGKDYTYDVDGCEVSSYTITVTTAENKQYGAGGIVGYATQKTRSIVNSSVSNCLIQIDGTQGSHGMGAIVGNTEQSIMGYNIIATDNTFAYYNSGTSAKVGNFIGNSNGKEIKVVGFSRNDNVIGDVGVSLEYGSTVDEKSYIICSDYLTSCTANDANSEMQNLISGITYIDDGVNDDYSPHAITNPKIMIGSERFITSDGAYAGAAEKIIYDLDDSAANHYNVSKYGNVIKKTGLQDRMEALANAEDEDKYITTYDNEMGLPEGSDMDDFEILALGGVATNGDYTDTINEYIQLLTNTKEMDYTSLVDSSNRYKISIYPCRYDNGNYAIITDTTVAKSSLTLNSSKQYRMDDSIADSIQPGKQFTLIDVEFLDPMNTGEVVYHLFVPVLTQKTVKFEFRSAAQGDTEYESTGYATKLAQANDTYAGNFNEWMTLYLQFKYTQSEMNDMLGTGKGLNWNSEKQVNFTYGSSKHLASTTEFVLLDANCNLDKEYYLTKSGISTTSTTGNAAIDHIVFSNFKQKDGTTSFTTQTINDIAGTKIRYEAVASGVYIECTNDSTKENATVYAYDSNGENKKYFIAYDSETTIGEGYGERYTLTTSGDVIENYYLSIYAFSKDNYGSDHTNTAYEFRVSSPVTLSGNVTCKRSNYTTSTVYLGNLFEQTMNVNADNTKSMQVGANTVSATLTSTVSFADPGNAAFFQGRLHNANVVIYQGFLVYLKRYGDLGGLQSDTLIYGSPDYTYSYTLDGTDGLTRNYTLAENASFIYLEPVEIVIPAYDGTIWSSTHVENLTVSFPNTEAALQKEFMPRYSDGSIAGNGFSASANLAYEPDDVRYSNIKETGESSQRYYVSAEEKIDLLFEADNQIVDDEYDKYGEQSNNRSSLGINSKYIDTGTKYADGYGNKEYIEAVASLDTSRIPDAYKGGNYNLIYTLSLWQKQDDPANDYGFVYVEVPIDTYLSNFKLMTDPDGDGKLGEINSGTYITKNVNGAGEYVYTFDLDSTISNWAIAFDQTEEIFDARATFDVKTAGDFEDISEYIYANYKLKLTAQLVPKTGVQNLSSYEDSDWIVYTHAKVNAQFVTDGN